MKQTLKKYFIPHEENEYKPHLFREEAITAVLLIVLVIFGGTVLTKITIKKSGLGAAVLPAVVYDLTNDARVQNSEAKLSFSATLARAAQLKADDMAKYGYFAHTSPQGVTPWHWFTEVNYLFFYAGENLAIDFSQSQDVENAWLKSPGHRANILNQNFTEIGIATKDGYYLGHPTTYVVQLFGTPAIFASPVTDTSTEKASVPTTSTSSPSPEGAHTTVPTSSNHTVLPASAASAPLAPLDSASSEATKDENVRVIGEDKNFVAVENTTSGIQPAADLSKGNSNTPESSWIDRFIINPGALMVNIYKILGAVILCGLCLMVLIRIEKQHPLNILYGVVVLVLMFSLAYLYGHFFEAQAFLSF